MRTKSTRVKAAVYRQYGPPEVVNIEAVDKPTPKGYEVLVKIHATTVSSADWRARSLIVPRGFGLFARFVVDHPIGPDRPKEDFTRTGRTYDIILDAVGEASFPKCETALTPGGRLLLVVAGALQMLDAVWRFKPDRKKVLAGEAWGGTADLLFLRQLAEAGQFKPVIDRRYPLEQIVEAHRRVDTKRKRGSVVIIVDRDDRV